MNDQSKTSDQKSSKGTPSAISLPGSVAGAVRYVSQDGPTTDLCGPVPARASLSARQAKEKGLLTSGTFGPLGTISSASAALRSSLVSRLTQRFVTVGLILFRLTWKESVTPAGSSVFLLRASAHRTSDSGCGSWPSPTVEQTTHCYGANKKIQLRVPGVARLTDFSDKWPEGSMGVASWGTPNTKDDNNSRRTHEGMVLEWNRPGGSKSSLAKQAVMLPASWPTPKTPTGGANSNRAERGAGVANIDEAAQWATPSARDWKNGTTSEATVERNSRPLNEQAVMLANWATPTTQDHSRGTNPPRPTDTGIPLSQQASGMPVSGCPVETGKRGQLNPALPRWLMGYPKEWCECAPSAAKLTRKTRTTKTCEFCKKSLARLVGVWRRKYCSRECMAKAFVKTPKTKTEGRNQAKQLYRADDCETCGKSGPYLHRHHKDRNPMNNDRENISILCVSCHTDVHFPNRAKNAGKNQTGSPTTSNQAPASQDCAATAMQSFPRLRRESSEPTSTTPISCDEDFMS